VSAAAARSGRGLVCLVALLFGAAAQETRPKDDVVAWTEEAVKLAEAGDFDASIGLLEKAAAARPADRTTVVNVARMLGRRASWHAREGRSREADSDLDRAVKLAPEERYLRVVRAGLWRDLGDVFRAESEVLRVLTEEPSLAYAFEELARCKYDGDDLAAALEALDAANKLDPERAKATASFLEKLKREFAAESEFDRVERGPFAVKFDSKEFRGAADAVLDLLDSAERKIRDRFGHVPRRRVTAILYTRKDFASATGAHGWTGGLFDGKIRLPIRNFASARAEIEKTVVHEFMHAVVRDLTKRCPTWLNEGLAQLAEDKSLAHSKAVLKGAEIESFAKMPDAWATIADGEIVRRRYAQAHLFTAFLQNDRGPLAFRDLLSKLDGKTSFGEAFSEVYGRGFDEAETAWRESRGS
jgi:tetratricopeptide (TPR) repeat protein